MGFNWVQLQIKIIAFLLLLLLLKQTQQRNIYRLPEVSKNEKKVGEGLFGVPTYNC